MIACKTMVWNHGLHPLRTIQGKTAWVDSACADCPGFLFSVCADAPLPSFVQEPQGVSLD